MTDYKLKYLKYKRKYLELKGGTSMFAKVGNTVHKVVAKLTPFKPTAEALKHQEKLYITELHNIQEWLTQPKFAHDANGKYVDPDITYNNHITKFREIENWGKQNKQLDKSFMNFILSINLLIDQAGIPTTTTLTNEINKLREQYKIMTLAQKATQDTWQQSDEYNLKQEGYRAERNAQLQVEANNRQANAKTFTDSFGIKRKK